MHNDTHQTMASMQPATNRTAQHTQQAQQNTQRNTHARPAVARKNTTPLHVTTCPTRHHTKAQTVHKHTQHTNNTQSNNTKPIPHTFAHEEQPTHRAHRVLRRSQRTSAKLDSSLKMHTQRAPTRAKPWQTASHEPHSATRTTRTTSTTKRTRTHMQRPALPGPAVLTLGLRTWIQPVAAEEHHCMTEHAQRNTTQKHAQCPNTQNTNHNHASQQHKPQSSQRKSRTHSPTRHGPLT